MPYYLPSGLRFSGGMRWADYGWDPITGCTGVSSGCRNCMSRTSGWRARPGMPFTPTVHEQRLLDPVRERRPRRILVASQSDIFHPQLPQSLLPKLLEIMHRANHHQYLLLTKRPERALELLPHCRWPQPHVHVGISAENQQCLDQRLPLLQQIPVAAPGFRYLSLEPLLGPITIGPGIRDLRWVICGAERACARRRPLRRWFEQLKLECKGIIPIYHHRSRDAQDHQLPEELQMKNEIIDVTATPMPTSPEIKLLLPARTHISRQMLAQISGIEIGGQTLVFVNDLAPEAPIPRLLPASTQIPPLEVVLADFQRLRDQEFESNAQMGRAIGITHTLIARILRGEPIKADTQRKVSEFFTRRHNQACTYVCEVYVHNATRARPKAQTQAQAEFRDVRLEDLQRYIRENQVSIYRLCKDTSLSSDALKRLLEGKRVQRKVQKKVSAFFTNLLHQPCTFICDLCNARGNPI